VSPEEIKQLRQDLKLSARELASAIRAEAEDVWAWENGERFPTKRFVSRMLALRKKSGVSVQAQAEPRAPATTSGQESMRGLADPVLWQIVRKLLAHPALFADVTELAKRFTDPAVLSKPAKGD
jgi:transcriptional regulator with XRE-family HTH domain